MKKKFTVTSFYLLFMVTRLSKSNSSYPMKLFKFALLHFCFVLIPLFPFNHPPSFFVRMHIQEHLSKWMQHNIEKAAGNFCSVLFLPTFEGQTAPRNVRAPLLETGCRFSFPSWKPALAASFQVYSELTSHSLSSELQLNRIRLSD